mgnify:CR=1 FL=1
MIKIRAFLHFLQAQTMNSAQSELERAYVKMRLYLKMAVFFASVLFVIACVWAFAEFKEGQNALKTAQAQNAQMQKRLEITLAEKNLLLERLEILAQSLEFLSQKNANFASQNVPNFSNLSLTNETALLNLVSNLALANETALPNLNSANKPNPTQLSLNSAQNSSTLNPKIQNLNTTNSAQNLPNLNSLQGLNSKTPEQISPQNASLKTLAKAKPQIHSVEMNASSLEAEFAQKAQLATALNLAHLHLANKDYEKAILWSFKANSLDKSEARAWLIYAKAKFAQGKKDEAKRVLQSFMNHYSKDFDEDVGYILNQ